MWYNKGSTEMKLTDVEFVRDVPGGIKVQHNACGHQFCISHSELFQDGIECPVCCEVVTKPEDAWW
jgi:nitrite reductase/ring-hydroxylating ferredoxin subunit